MSESDLLTISRVGPGMQLKIFSDPATLRPVRLALEDFGRESGLAPSEADEIGLALNEALANVMRHGYGGATDKPIVVQFEHRGARGTGQVQVTIRDWGKPVDPAGFPSGQTPPDPDKITPGGLGLLCMRKLMDSVVFSPQPDGMVLTMTKKLGNTKLDGAKLGAR